MVNERGWKKYSCESLNSHASLWVMIFFIFSHRLTAVLNHFYLAIKSSHAIMLSFFQRKEWRRRDGGKAFNRDALLKDISRTRLGGLKHVDGFSYEA